MMSVKEHMKKSQQLRKAIEQREELETIRTAILDAAQEWVEEGQIEIDPGAVISIGEDGAYVQAWVYVDSESVDLPAKFEDEQTGEWGWPEDCANPVAVEDLVESLKELVKAFTSGIHYQRKNPYARPYVKKALELLARHNGADTLRDPTCYMDVNLNDVHIEN